MNMNQLTQKALEAINGAQNLATGNGNPELTPEHLLATLTGGGGLIDSLLERLG